MQRAVSYDLVAIEVSSPLPLILAMIAVIAVTKTEHDKIIDHSSKTEMHRHMKSSAYWITPVEHCK